MAHDLKFTVSQIKYLVALYRLSQNGCGVKSAELAYALGVSRPSVHNMLKSLADLGMVQKEFFGVAFFTDAGRAYAQKYAVCYAVLEQKMTEICGRDAASENAICGLIADMPPEKLDALYQKEAQTADGSGAK